MRGVRWGRFDCTDINVVVGGFFVDGFPNKPDGPPSNCCCDFRVAVGDVDLVAAGCDFGAFILACDSILRPCVCGIGEVLIGGAEKRDLGSLRTKRSQNVDLD